MTSFLDRVRVSRRRAAFPDRSGRHRVVEIGDLTVSEIDRWLELRASNPELDSPYFHPGFAAAVAATRGGVRVILERDPAGSVGSFLPVQFDRRICRPVGCPAADFQGPICAAGTGFDIAAAMRSSGAWCYQFDHMRDGIAEFQPWILDRQRSPYIDISGGLDGYLSRASRSGKDNIAQARRRGRKAETEHGSLRFVAESHDATLLDTVIALKRRQYLATGSRDYFSNVSHVRLVHRLLGERETDFSGMLSAVFAGPHLLAAHFGLRSGPVLHWWFPVYDPEFSRLAPGWLLLRALVEAAQDLGLARIDLGRGEDEYKRRAMTGYQVVCQGAAIPNRWFHQAELARRKALEAAKSSRAAPMLRDAVHYARGRRKY